MQALKIALVIATGLGAAWTADFVTGEAPGRVMVAQAEAPDDTAAAGDESEIEDLSEAELEAEIDRIEAAAGDDEELEEFVPTKPLPADIPISLPSDI